MAAERMRLFRGVTELNYNQATFNETNDQVVNQGRADIEADDTVVIGSTIDFRKKDGTTTVFTAQIIEIKKDFLWSLKLLGPGFELMNIKVEQVFENISPEDLVKDVVDNFMENLVFASTEVSNVIIDKYIANDYGAEVVKDMIDLLQWQFRVDENNNVFFEPRGNINNGLTFTNGDNFTVDGFEEDDHQLFNSVKVKGGFQSFNTIETLNVPGGSTEYILTNKPQGSMKIIDNANEVDPSTYTVDSDLKRVTFDVARTNVTFQYSFDRPVVVVNQNDQSIADNGEIFQEINAPWLDSFSSARRYSQNLLDTFSVPLVKSKGTEPQLNFDSIIGEQVQIVDPVRDRQESLVITRKTLDAANDKTIYNFGTREFIFFDWQRNVQERIKTIERQFLNEDDITFTRLFKHTLKITMDIAEVFEFNDPVDSFILGHETLSRLRPDLNFEADCSDNANNGVWSGTGIGGSQYNITGFKLSTGVFNGTDRIITVNDVANLRFTGDFSIALAVKVASLPSAETFLLNKFDGTDGYAARINASNQVEFIYSDSGSDTVIAASTALTAGMFQHVVFTKSGTSLVVYVSGVSDNTATGGATVGSNTNDFIVGKSGSNFFGDQLDEVRLYSSALSGTDVLNLFNLLTVTTNQVCYLSMDNPRLGDRSTARAPVT